MSRWWEPSLPLRDPRRTFGRIEDRRGLAYRYITPGRILDRGVAFSARHPLALGRHRVHVEPFEPRQPVGPPAAGMLLRAAHEGVERIGVIAGPVLVLVGSG